MSTINNFEFEPITILNETDGVDDLDQVELTDLNCDEEVVSIMSQVVGLSQTRQEGVKEVYSWFREFDRSYTPFERTIPVESVTNTPVWHVSPESLLLQSADRVGPLTIETPRTPSPATLTTTGPLLLMVASEETPINSPEPVSLQDGPSAFIKHVPLSKELTAAIVNVPKLQLEQPLEPFPLDVNEGQAPIKQPKGHSS